MGKGWVGCAQGCARVTWLRCRTSSCLLVRRVVRERLPVRTHLHALHRLGQHVGGQRFGAHAELQGLLGRHDADGAPPLEPAVEAQLGGENGRERHQDERDDERHPALAARARDSGESPVGAHPATSTSRRTRPQSLNSMVISTATGRVHSPSACGRLRRRPLALPGLIAVEVAQLHGLHAAEQVLNHGCVPCTVSSAVV